MTFKSLISMTAYGLMGAILALSIGVLIFGDTPMVNFVSIAIGSAVSSTLAYRFNWPF